MVFFFVPAWFGATMGTGKPYTPWGTAATAVDTVDTAGNALVTARAAAARDAIDAVKTGNARLAVLAKEFK